MGFRIVDPRERLRGLVRRSVSQEDELIELPGQGVPQAALRLLSFLHRVQGFFRVSSSRFPRRFASGSQWPYNGVSPPHGRLGQARSLLTMTDRLLLPESNLLLPSAATVERQQLAENVVIGDVRRPTVCGRHSRVKGLVRIDEPLRASVVEVRQRALLDRLRRGLVAGNRAFRIAGDRLLDPLDPLGRVKPAVAQFCEPSGFQGFRCRYAITYLKHLVLYANHRLVPLAVSLVLNRISADEEQHPGTARESEQSVPRSHARHDPL